MQKVIIADATCLILLQKIDQLVLLRDLFSVIVVTSVIAAEFKVDLPEWIEIRDAPNFIYPDLNNAAIDKGEASAMALALWENDSLLILDDLKARKFAAKLNIKYTGTLGLIVEAKQSGYIESVMPLISKIKETDFYITPAVEQKILRLAGEL
jgi:predicted nucleic acid-binding protein